MKISYSLTPKEQKATREIIQLLEPLGPTTRRAVLASALLLVDAKRMDEKLEVVMGE